MPKAFQAFYPAATKKNVAKSIKRVKDVKSAPTDKWWHGTPILHNKLPPVFSVVKNFNNLFFCTMLHLKQELLKKCFEYADDRIKSTENAITSAKEASQDDTKSSAGDKYETTREMMQQEISRNEAQLYEAKKLKHALLQIQIEKVLKTVQNGSLVFTNNGNFFISVSAGQFNIDSQNFFAISSASPIGKLLAGLKKGGKFNFNGKEFEVLEIK